MSMNKRFVVLVNGVKATETLTAHKAKRLSDKYNANNVKASFGQKLPNSKEGTENVTYSSPTDVFKFLNQPKGGK